MDGEHHRRFELSPLFIGLLGIIAGAIMVAIYHCIVITCTSQRRVPNSTNQRQNRQTNQEDRPSSTQFSSATLQQLPIYRHTKESREFTCAICLSDFDEGEGIRVLPECLHSFHAPCIDMWLYNHSNCPICRADTRCLPSRHVIVTSMPHSVGVPP